MSGFSGCTHRMAKLYCCKEKVNEGLRYLDLCNETSEYKKTNPGFARHKTGPAYSIVHSDL